MSESNLILIGFMGTGKTTLGKLCAERLNYAFHDSDAVIEERAGCSIAELFTREGEARFRQREREAIAHLAARSHQVIATGGGAILAPENAAALRAGGRVVLLHASPEAILNRVGDASTRPLLAGASDPHARIAALLQERAERYAQAAHHQIQTTHRAPEEIAEEIVAWFETTCRAKSVQTT